MGTAKKRTLSLTKEEHDWLLVLLSTLDLGWLTNTEQVTGKTNKRQNMLRKKILDQLREGD